MVLRSTSGVLRSISGELRSISGGRGMGSHGRQLAGWVPGGHTIASYSQFRVITYSINKVPKNVTNQLLPEISDSGVSGAAPELLRRLRSSEKLQKSSSDQSPGKNIISYDHHCHKSAPRYSQNDETACHGAIMREIMFSPTFLHKIFGF